MKLLAEISDRTLGIGEAEKIGASYGLRKSARVILHKSDGTIAIQKITRDQFYKLPGGGIENTETVEEALVREIREEVGCGVKVGECIGAVIEYRAKHQIIQMSYCFTGQAIEPFGEPLLEQAEIDEGLEHEWVTPEEALQLIEKGTPTTYQGNFIVVREGAFLKEYLENYH